jgi:hypothetical protein
MSINFSLLEVALKTAIIYAIMLATSEDVGIAMSEVDGSISVLKKDELPSVVHQHHRIQFLIKNKQ